MNSDNKDEGPNYNYEKGFFSVTLMKYKETADPITVG
jgi:hypothetical protein